MIWYSYVNKGAYSISLDYLQVAYNAATDATTIASLKKMIDEVTKMQKPTIKFMKSSLGSCYYINNGKKKFVSKNYCK